MTSKAAKSARVCVLCVRWHLFLAGRDGMMRQLDDNATIRSMTRRLVAIVHSASLLIAIRAFEMQQFGKCASAKKKTQNTSDNETHNERVTMSIFLSFSFICFAILRFASFKFVVAKPFNLEYCSFYPFFRSPLSQSIRFSLVSNMFFFTLLASIWKNSFWFNTKRKKMCLLAIRSPNKMTQYASFINTHTPHAMPNRNCVLFPRREIKVI